MVTYISNPVSRLNDGVVDENFLAKVAKFGGGKIGYSTVSNPAVVNGPNQTWTMANPMPGQPGILVARVSFNALGLAHFARIMDSRGLIVGGNLTVNHDTLLDDVTVVGSYNNISVAGATPASGIGYVVSTGLVTGNQLVTKNIVDKANNGVGGTNFAIPQQPCGPVGSTGVAATGELYTCRFNLVLGGYWILASEPDCQIPTVGAGATTYTNFGSQSFIVSADQNIQIPQGCFYTKFTFSDSAGSFAGNDFTTFNRSNSLDGQVVQSFMNMFSNEAIIMDKNQQIIAHQTANAVTLPSKFIKVEIAKD
jgi:hypothetical protein